MRLKLVRDNTSIDFFNRARLWLGISFVMMIGDLVGLHHVQPEVPVDVAAYRDVLAPLDLGDVSIAEVFDPTFEENQHVTMVRIQAQEGDERIASETIAEIQAALHTIDPGMEFPSVSSVFFIRSRK